MRLSWCRKRELEICKAHPSFERIWNSINQERVRREWWKPWKQPQTLWKVTTVFTAFEKKGVSVMLATKHLGFGRQQSQHSQWLLAEFSSWYNCRLYRCLLVVGPCCRYLAYCRKHRFWWVCLHCVDGFLSKDWRKQSINQLDNMWVWTLHLPKAWTQFHTVSDYCDVSVVPVC